MGVREAYGLRHDLEHVRRVATDPSATHEWGLPLLPAEAGLLRAQSRAVDSAAERAEAYSREFADEFGGMRLEHPADGGGLVIYFTANVERHRAFLNALLGIPIRVELVQYTAEELDALLQRVIDAIPRLEAQGAGPQGVWIDVTENVVKLEAVSANPNLAARLEAEFGPALRAIVSQPPPSDWSQPESGNGWRFLDSARNGTPYSMAAATDADTFGSLWTPVFGEEPLPAVDFGSEIVAFFGQAAGCSELRLDAVEFDHADRLVYGVWSDPLAVGWCTAVLAPHTFVVALDRSSLPPSPFTVRLERDFIACGDCGPEREEVVVDLTSP